MMMPFSMSLRATAFVGGVIISAMVAGCGSRVPDGMVVVTGTISLAGTALQKGAVHFVPAGRQQTVAARIEGGRFQAMMRPMEYRIAVTADAQPELVDETTGKLIQPVSLVPIKYARAETSGLTANVSPDKRSVRLELVE